MQEEEITKTFYEKVKHIFTTDLITIDGGPSITLLMILYVVGALLLLIFLSGKLANFLDRRVLKKRIPDYGTRDAILKVFRYAIICLGILAIFQSAGIKIESFMYLFTALGVGIGFGLQNITQNFISGIIILFERPIKVGDRIEVGDISGDVASISMRSTKILTNDNINVIVPNSEFINDKVINWSYNERRVRFKFPVGVSYNEDPDKVRKIAVDIAKKHKGVLPYPEPDLWFSEYGDNSLNFLLVVWTSSYIQKPPVLKSELYYELFKAFSEEGIEIPFPQRDIHFRSGMEGFNFEKINQKLQSFPTEKSDK